MIPIILAVSAKQDGSVSQVLENVRRQAGALAAGLNVNLLPPSALSGLTAAATQFQVMRDRVRGVTTELESMKQALDQTLQAPGLAQQAAGYDQILTRLNSLDPATKAIIERNRELKAVYASLTQSAAEGLQNVADRAKFLGGQAGNVAAGFAGVGGVLAGIAVGSLSVASSFEQLTQRLVASTGSITIANRKLEEAKAFAAASPFDLASAVRATVTIESFKQNSEELLPVAAALAAGLGTDLQQATLAVGKAAAGSTDAWLQLRDTYGITADEVVKFGGVASKTGGLLDYSTASVQKNKEALIKLIQTRFGDSVAKQAATLAGAASNVGDAIQVAAASFGQTLLPISTQGARALASLLGVVSAVPGPLKALAAAGVVVGAGLAGVGAAAAGSIAALLLMQGALAANVLQMRQLGIQSPIASAALQAFSAGTARAAGAMTTARLASVGLIGAFGTVAAVAAVVGSSLIDTWQKAEEAMGDSITQSSRQFADSVQEIRKGAEGLNRANQAAGQNVGKVVNSATSLSEVAAQLRKLPSGAIVDGFNLMGQSLEQVDNKVRKLERTSADAKEALDALIAARGRLNEQTGAFDPGTRQGTPERFREVQAGLAGKGIKVDNAEDIDRQTEAYSRFLNNVGKGTEYAKAQSKAYREVVVPLQQAAEKSETLSKFLNLATQAGTTQSLAIALADVNAQIDANAKLTKGAAANVDVLIAKLNDPKVVGDERALAEAQLKLVQQRGSILEAQTKQAEEARKAELDANELVFRKRKAQLNLSLTAEVQFLQTQLKLTKDGSEEQVRILEEIRAKKDQIHEKEVASAKRAAERQAKAAKDAFSKVLQGANQGVADARAGFGTGPAAVSASPYPQATSKNAGVEPNVLNSLELARLKVEAWATANAKLLKAYPEIQADLEKFRSSNAIDQQKAKAEQLKTTLESLNQQVQTDLANSANNTQRLAVVKAGLETLEKSRRAGLVTEAGAINQINALTRQRASLEQQISQEVAQRAQETANLELSNNESSLQILQARKAAGERVDTEILAKQKQIFQQKLALIEQERQARVDAANGEASAIEAINKQAQLKKDGLINAETLARQQAADQQTQAVDKALSAQEARYQQFAQRIGGANSPLQSFEEAFGGPGSFSLGNFSLTEQLRKASTVSLQGPNRLRQIQAQVGFEANGPNAQAQEISRQVNASEQKKRDALRRDPNLGVGGAAGGGQGAGGGGQTTVSIYVNGAKMEASEPEINAAVKGVLNRVARRKRMTGK